MYLKTTPGHPISAGRHFSAGPPDDGKARRYAPATPVVSVLPQRGKTDFPHASIEAFTPAALLSGLFARINFPFQSAGGTILRNLVRELMTLKRNNQLDADILATIHDAIFFEVNAGDYATIEKISNIMKDCANKTLSAVDYSIKVGKPDIIKHGDIWCADNANFVEQFKELLNYRDDD